MGKSINRSDISTNFGGFNFKFVINKNQISTLTDIVSNSSFWDTGNMGYLFSDPSDAFVSLRVYPFDVFRFFYGSSATYTNLQETIWFGKLEYDLGGGNKFKAVSLTKQSISKFVCKFTIDRKYNNFLDYAPYTKLELYLPYASIVTLDTNVVMGKEVRIFLSVDFDSGACTYYIEVDDNVIMFVTGQMGLDIPLGSFNENERNKRMLTTGYSAMGGILMAMASENPTTALIATGLLTESKLVGASQVRITKGGATSGSQALSNPIFPYLIRTCNIPNTDQENHAKTKGLPLNKECVLGDLSGFTKIEDAHLDGFTTATSSELDELMQIMKDGFIL